MYMYPGISKSKRYEKDKRQDQNIFYVTQGKKSTCQKKNCFISKHSYPHKRMRKQAKSWKKRFSSDIYDEKDYGLTYTKKS